MPERQNRFNFTNRQRILLSHVELAIQGGESGTEVVLSKLELESYSLPPSAEVVLEARIGRRDYQRLSLGTVRSHELRKMLDLEPYEVSGATFTLKVVGTESSDRGRLLAVADNLSPSADKELRSLLPISPSEELGQCLWQLVISEDTGPELLINSDCGDWQGLARKPDFQSLVFPKIISEIAKWLVLTSEVDEPEGSPAGKWRRLLETYGANLQEAPEFSRENGDLAQFSMDLNEWTSQIEKAFSNIKRPLERYLQIQELSTQ
jgi:hypothetical protein